MFSGGQAAYKDMQSPLQPCGTLSSSSRDKCFAPCFGSQVRELAVSGAVTKRLWQIQYYISNYSVHLFIMPQ